MEGKGGVSGKRREREVKGIGSGGCCWWFSGFWVIKVVDEFVLYKEVMEVEIDFFYMSIRLVILFMIRVVCFLICSVVLYFEIGCVVDYIIYILV